MTVNEQFTSNSGTIHWTLTLQLEIWTVSIDWMKGAGTERGFIEHRPWKEHDKPPTALKVETN
jgi:hypothetical protein